MKSFAKTLKKELAYYSDSGTLELAHAAYAAAAKKHFGEFARVR